VWVIYFFLFTLPKHEFFSVNFNNKVHHTYLFTSHKTDESHGFILGLVIHHMFMNERGLESNVKILSVIHFQSATVTFSIKYRAKYNSLVYIYYRKMLYERVIENHQDCQTEQE
jgi:hypothetical protein